MLDIIDISVQDIWFVVGVVLLAYFNCQCWKLETISENITFIPKISFFFFLLNYKLDTICISVTSLKLSVYGRCMVCGSARTG